MSFTSKLEEAIQKSIGFTPCKDTDGAFYYDVTGVRRTGCCLVVTVNITIKSCLDDMMGRMCKIASSLDWDITRDPDFPNDDDKYIATLTLLDIMVSCDCNKGTGTIQDIQTTINE